MFIYQWYQSFEVLSVAVCVQGRTIRPFLYEYEVPKVFLIDEKIVGNT